MIEIAFWFFAALVLYPYVGYPALLYLSSRTVPARKYLLSDELPRVTLLISAFNEEGCIAEKLENSLKLDYPNGLIDIIVISDASADSTDDIVMSFENRGVLLLRMNDRGGKTLGLNAGVAEARGDIIVFSDANAMYREDAIRALVAPFSDPGIGAVVGESTYVYTDLGSGRSESLYWRYETTIKELESRSGSVVGGDGAIYALRKDLYNPMQADALSDFVNPLQVVKSNYRCVYEPNAISYEGAAPGFAQEFRRKVRIVNRAWRAVISMKEMLNPFRFGVFALKLWSHKVLRWWVPLAIFLTFGINIALLGRHSFYWLTAAIQIIIYLFAIIGYLNRNGNFQPAAIRVPFYFCLVNVAAALGLWEAFLGKRYATWETTRDGR